MSECALNQVIADDLSYLRTVAESGGLDAESSASLSGAVEALARKAASGELQLSVFGEFNTGKSTFINALLGQEILTTARRPTTQVCVYIRYGPELRITASMPDGSVISVPVEDVAEVVSEQGSLKHALRVDISLPSDRLQDGLVIVDTPGINVDIDRHMQITEEAAAESNACVFIMKATMPGAKTSIDYLRRISASVDKLFLVLNMCDLLDKCELSEAVGYLNEVLHSECEISDPRVHPISSLKSSRGSGFDEFVGELQTFMKREKDIVIAREVAKLEQRVMFEASRLVGDRRHLHEEELERRYHQAMPDSETLVAQLRDDTSCALRKGLAEFTNLIDKERCGTIKRIRSAVENRISRAPNKKHLQESVPKEIESCCGDHLSTLNRSVQQAQEKLFGEVTCVIDGCFAGLFESVRNLEWKLVMLDPLLYVLSCTLLTAGAFLGYCATARGYIGPHFGNLATAAAGLAGLIVAVSVHRLIFVWRGRDRYHLPTPTLSGVDFYFSRRLAEGTITDVYRKGTEEIVMQGATSSARVGTYALWQGGDIVTGAIMAGAMAALTGVFVGLRALWDWAFGPSLEDRKNEIRQKIAPMLDALEKQINSRLDMSLNGLMHVLPDYCDDRIVQLDKRYETLMMRIAKRQKAQIAKVKERVSALQEIESQLDKRTERIVEQLAASRGQQAGA